MPINMPPAGPMDAPDLLAILLGLAPGPMAPAAPSSPHAMQGALADKRVPLGAHGNNARKHAPPAPESKAQRQIRAKLEAKYGPNALEILLMQKAHARQGKAAQAFDLRAFSLQSALATMPGSRYAPPAPPGMAPVPGGAPGPAMPPRGLLEL